MEPGFNLDAAEFEFNPNVEEFTYSGTVYEDPYEDHQEPQPMQVEEEIYDEDDLDPERTQIALHYAF
jgi:hypothetical protein